MAKPTMTSFAAASQGIDRGQPREELIGSEK